MDVIILYAENALQFLLTTAIRSSDHDRLVGQKTNVQVYLHIPARSRLKMKLRKQLMVSVTTILWHLGTDFHTCSFTVW